MLDGAVRHIVDIPLVVFALAFLAQWISACLANLIRKRLRPVRRYEWEDINVVLTATLTLLGLIIAFSFSMAINRYDQRKNFEEAEANAIGTEYVRADVLSSADAAQVRQLLRNYLDQRVLFYKTRDERELQQINAFLRQLQTELWSTVLTAATRQPTPVVALAVSGMNEVLNLQGYIQAAWWNRIPVAAWGLMATIAICCNLLYGYHARTTSMLLFLILPLMVSISFLLIADIDSPRGGLIRVLPQNLVSLSQSLNAGR
jgi:hypothetical protein